MEQLHNKYIIFGNGKETKQTKIHASADHRSDTFWCNYNFQSQYNPLRMVHAAHLSCGCNHPVHAFGSFPLFTLRPVYPGGITLSDRADSVFNLQKDKF